VSAERAVEIIGRLFIFCMICLSACSGLQTPGGTVRAEEINLEGVWEGLSVNDCSAVQVDPGRCRAVQRISFTMLTRDGKLAGFYRCGAGTTPCYNLVEHGIIKALELHGRSLWFRVMRDDHSSCLFNAEPSVKTMAGGFFCFQGSALIERGYWQVNRVY
jgi:hypothetical protein